MIVIALAIFVGAVLMSEMDSNMKIVLIVSTAVMYYLLGATVPIVAAVVGVGIIAKEKLV